MTSGEAWICAQLIAEMDGRMIPADFEIAKT
jgi:hypothetical protein